MGFLDEFAYGFSQTAKPIFEARSKANAEADAQIRARIAAVEPEMEVVRRKADIEKANALELAREKVRLEREETDRLFKMWQNGGGTPSTAPPPATATPESTVALPETNLQQPSTASDYNRNMQGAFFFKFAGKDDMSQALKLEADRAKENRNIGRESVLSIEGTDPTETFSKAEANRLTAKELVELKYHKKPLTVNPKASLPSEKALMQKEVASSALAAKVVNTIANATADANGRSPLSGAEMTLDATRLVRAKNILLDPESSPEELAQARQDTYEVLHDYPGAEHTIAKSVYTPDDNKKIAARIGR